MQCCPWSWRQQYAGKNPVRSCFNTLGSKLHTKNLLQCCLNTPWTTLHRLNRSLCNVVVILLGQYFTGKTRNLVWEAPDNIVQEKIPCNFFWTPSGHFLAFTLDRLIFYQYLVAANTAPTLLKFSRHCTRKIPGQNRTKRQAYMEQWYCTCMLKFISFSILSRLFLFLTFPYLSFIIFCHITFYTRCSFSVFVRNFPFRGFRSKF